MIIDRLIDKITATGNPIVVGLDPRTDYVPEFIMNEAAEKHGKGLKALAEAFFVFNKGIIDAVCDIAPAVKPQVAMYEMLGADGIKSYIDTINYARQKGLIVIGDVKRSDIASTAQAYSDGHIGEVLAYGKSCGVFSQDFITLNPYLGWDSIEPYMDNCRRFERGLFILVKTSNPNSGQIQDLDCGGQPLYEKIGSLVDEWGTGLMGGQGYSSIGAVVGATHPSQAERLRRVMPKTFFLVPGYGAQGGTAEDLSVCFDKNGLGAIINSSRGIIAAYKKKDSGYDEKDYAEAARQAVIDMGNDLRRVL